MYKILFIIGLVFTFFSCRKEITSWNTSWELPLFNDKLDLTKFINDSTLAVSNNTIEVNLNRNILSLKPSEFIKIPDTSINEKFAISVNQLNVPPGFSFVTDNDDFVFDLDEIELKHAILRAGKIELAIENPVPTATIFQITLPGVKKDDVSLSRSITVPPANGVHNGKASLTVDLANYHLFLTGNNGLKVNSLSSNLSVKTDPNGPSVLLTNQDSTIINLSLNNLEFDYARGYFGQFQLDTLVNFDIPFINNQLNGDLSISPIDVNFAISNGIKLNAEAIIKSLKNTNINSQNEVSLSGSFIGSPFTIQQAMGTWDNFTPSNLNLSLTSDNSNIESFIANLGGNIEADVDLKLNPYGNSSGGWDEFFSTSSFDIDMNIKSPLSIGSDGFALKNVYAFNPNIDDSLSTIIQDGKLILNYENAFPLNASIIINFLDENGTILATYSPALQIKSSQYGQLNNNILSYKGKAEIPIIEALKTAFYQIKTIEIIANFDTKNTNNSSQSISIPSDAFLGIKSAFSLILEHRAGQ